MPDYTIHDAKTGLTLTVRGEGGPPSDEEMTQLFDQASKTQASKNTITEGAKRQLGEQWGGLKAIGAALSKMPSQSEFHQHMESMRHPEAKVSLQNADPTGIASAVQNNEGWKTKLGRVGVLGVEAALPFAKKLFGTTAATEAAAATAKAAITEPTLASTTATAFAPAPEAGPVRAVPPSIPMMAEPPPKPSGFSTAPTGTGAQGAPVSGGPVIRIAAKAPEKPVAITNPTEAANAAAKAEQEASGIKPPYREPVYGGTERRSPSRLSGAAEDKAYTQVRAEIERKAALQRARTQIGPSAITKPAEAQAVASTVEPHSAAQPMSVGAAARSDFKSLGGPGQMSKGYTSLAEMKAKYGAEGAAQRAGMSVDELEARLANPSNPEIPLRDRIGAEKAARQLGMQVEEVRAGGPSKIPTAAVERIKAVVAEKQAQGIPLTPQEESLLARIKSERGAINPKLLKLGLPVAGAAIGAAKDHEDPVRGGLLGLLGGGVLSNQTALRFLLGLRTEGFLSAGAIPKNVLNYVGATGTSAAENLTPATGRLGAAKELLRLPTNAKTWYDSFKNPPSFNKYGRTAGPLSRTIGAGDVMATKAFRRAGMAEPDIERMLLSKNRQLFAPKDVNSEGLGVLDVVYPFQRVPYNVLAEGAQEAGRTLGIKRGAKGFELNMRDKGALANPDMRTALTLASTAGGAALGEWAKGNKRRTYLAGIAMALLGPRAAIGTAAAMARGGRQAFGGISPIPEQGVDMKSFIGWPPTAVKAYEKLVHNR